MSSKYDIIMFTGLDRAGKSTTRKAFAEYTNQKFITWDRSFVDNFVFDEVFREKPDIGEFLRIATKFAELRTTIVFLGLSYDEINKRTLATENFEYDMVELKRVKEVYEKYLDIADELGIGIVVVDCNEKTTEQIIKETCEELDRPTRDK